MIFVGLIHFNHWGELTHLRAVGSEPPSTPTGKRDHNFYGLTLQHISPIRSKNQLPSDPLISSHVGLISSFDHEIPSGELT